jgi:hypothetical protein
VTETDAGSKLLCPCGFTVIVPLLEEFENRPVLLSAATVPRRIRRLIAEGELPGTTGCLQCHDTKTRGIINVAVECEKMRTRVSGGDRFYLFPVIIGWLWIYREEEQWVELIGQDTTWSLPICLCPDCYRQLGPLRNRLYLLGAALLVAFSVPLIYLHVVLGVTLGLVSLLVLFWLRSRAAKRQQNRLKNLLQRVPVYGQLLKQYPHAVLVLPEHGSDLQNDSLREPPASTQG